MSNKESIRIPACAHMWSVEEEVDNVGGIFLRAEKCLFSDIFKVLSL